MLPNSDLSNDTLLTLFSILFSKVLKIILPNSSSRSLISFDKYRVVVYLLLMVLPLDHCHLSHNFVNRNDLKAFLTEK